MITGRNLRLSRLFHAQSKKAILIPMDHGATVGPIPGLDVTRMVGIAESIAPAVQAVVLHRGVALNADQASSPARVPWMLHLSASTSLSKDPSYKVLVGQVEDAVRMGADGVSVHVNLGVPEEAAMIRDLGRVSAQCHQWGMPLLAMVYGTPVGADTASPVATLKQAARLAAELGADMVKISYPGSPEAMAEVVEGCFIPVLVAGGERNASDHKVMEQVRGAMQGGAAGICMGRNVFQHSSPSSFLLSLAGIVHEDHSPEVMGRTSVPLAAAALTQ